MDFSGFLFNKLETKLVGDTGFTGEKQKSVCQAFWTDRFVLQRFVFQIGDNRLAGIIRSISTGTPESGAGSRSDGSTLAGC